MHVIVLMFVVCVVCLSLFIGVRSLFGLIVCVLLSLSLRIVCYYVYLRVFAIVVLSVLSCRTLFCVCVCL